MEVLLAFTVAILFTVPLIEHSFKYCAKEVRYLEEMELQRMADLSFCEIKEMLLKNEVPWDELPRRGGISAHIKMKDAQIAIPGFPSKKIIRNVCFKGRGEKRGKNDEDILQLGVHIFLNNQEFEFRTPVLKKM